MPGGDRIPMPTLERLTTYFGVLSELKHAGVGTVSSADIEHRCGINAAQFRKDLSYFGEFGRPGIGYDVDELYARICGILKIDKPQPVLLVGAGNLGSALVGYPSLRSEHFQIVAVFDNNYNKIGKQLWDLTIKDIADIVGENRKLRARMGMIAVPASAAQEVAERLVDADVKTILNFAPTVLKLPSDVIVRQVDFIRELAVLSFHLPDQPGSTP